MMRSYMQATFQSITKDVPVQCFIYFSRNKTAQMILLFLLHYGSMGVLVVQVYWEHLLNELAHSKSMKQDNYQEVISDGLKLLICYLWIILLVQVSLQLTMMQVMQ